MLHTPNASVPEDRAVAGIEAVGEDALFERGDTAVFADRGGGAAEGDIVGDALVDAPADEHQVPYPLVLEEGNQGILSLGIQF